MPLLLPSTHSFTQPRRWSTWLLLLPLFSLMTWIFWPVTAGDFVADDYVFLTTGRMVDTPLAVFWQNHFYEPYYFRPLGVLSWWLATRLFGLDYALHSLINLALHCLNGVLLFGLLRALALRASAAFAGVSLFVLGPFATATMLWPSNRFDLLAVGFLLAQAILTRHALRGGFILTLAAALAALAACWSKELAYPVATTLACFALAARGISWRKRLTLFAVIGVAISSAFFVRHGVLADAYALTAADPFGRVLRGSAAMAQALPRLTTLIVGGPVSIALLGGLLVLLTVGLARVFRGEGVATRRSTALSARLVLGVGLLWLAAFIVQTPLAGAFVSMLDGGVFGTVTFARFYYAPWVVSCVLVALMLSFASGASVIWGRLLALTMVSLAVVSGFASRQSGESFAAWTNREVRPVSIAATATTEQVAGGASEKGCVVVLLGTQINHPYFRMFSDVTVKARTVAPDAVWRCHVMTESTPWLFAFRSGVAPAELPLRSVPDFGGKLKSDSTWGGIRYRYRLPAADVALLPGSRFFEWREQQFIEVTEEVLRGERRVVARDW